MARPLGDLGQIEGDPGDVVEGDHPGERTATPRSGHELTAPRHGPWDRPPGDVFDIDGRRRSRMLTR